MIYEFNPKKPEKTKPKNGDRERLYAARDSLSLMKIEWDKYFNGDAILAAEARERLVELIAQLRADYDYLKELYDLDSDTGDVVLLNLIQLELETYESNLNMI